jgi:carboxylesterase type B
MTNSTTLGIGKLRTLAEAEEMGAAMAARLEVESVNKLRGLQQQQLTGAQSPGIIVDGYVLKEDPAVTFAAGRQRPVAVLVGSNKDEGMALLPGGPNAQQTPEQFTAIANERFGPLAERYLGLYPAGNVQEATLSYVGSLSEELAWSMRMLAQRQAAVAAPSYVYLFTRVPPQAPGGRQGGAGAGAGAGAGRQVEIPYVFGNLGGSYTPGDQQLSEGIRSYWLSFAKTGKPTGPTADWPEWPSVQEGQGAVMLFGDAIGPAQVLAAPKAAFYDEAFARMVTGLRMGAGAPQ